MARILIIDDDEVARITSGAVLEAAGFHVAYAADGSEGVAEYVQAPFDVVVVDLVMPVKSGLRTIGELREIDADVRVIAMTGVAPADLDLAEGFGALHTLTKPIEPRHLRRAVESLLGSPGPR
jgi:DNA-binding response OmpR family regulator